MEKKVQETLNTSDVIQITGILESKIKWTQKILEDTIKISGIQTCTLDQKGREHVYHHT